jgi:hypothetical protein
MGFGNAKPHGAFAQPPVAIMSVMTLEKKAGFEAILGVSHRVEHND